MGFRVQAGIEQAGTGTDWRTLRLVEQAWALARGLDVCGAKTFFIAAQCLQGRTMRTAFSVDSG